MSAVKLENENSSGCFYTTIGCKSHFSLRKVLILPLIFGIVFAAKDAYESVDELLTTYKAAGD